MKEESLSDIRAEIKKVESELEQVERRKALLDEKRIILYRKQNNHPDKEPCQHVFSSYYGGCKRCGMQEWELKEKKQGD